MSISLLVQQQGLKIEEKKKKKLKMGKEGNFPIPNTI